MAINFDNALGIHPDALLFRSERTAVLANNLANADTPGFKARDISFQDLLDQQQQQQSSQKLEMVVTDQQHLGGRQDVAAERELHYRNPLQPAIDGNTVDTHVEQAEFAKNTLRYQASFTFLNSRFKGLTTAIKGQ